VQLITQLWNNLVFFVVTAFHLFVTLITVLWNALVSLCTTLYSRIAWLVNDAWTFLVNLITRPIDTLRDIVFGILKTFAKEFGEICGYVMTFLMTINVDSIFR
jgi:phage-related protein